jgi:glucan biosynthesis protein C
VLPFIIITAPLDNFFMTLLFFISGIASFYALQHRSKNQYIDERIKKVLIPFVLGTILICPVQAYFKGIYDGFSGNYIEFIPQFFSGKIVDYLGYAHFWFLLYLFVFSLICIPLFNKWQNDNTILNNISSFLCKGNKIYIPIAFIMTTELLLRPFFPGKQILIMDWANDIVYLSMFIFGFVFASNCELQKRINSLTKLSMCLVIICISIFTYIYYMWIVHDSKAIYLTFVWAFVKGIYECSAIILLLGTGEKYLNKKSLVLSYLSKASFTYYFMHLLPVTVFTYFLVKTNLNIYLKYLLVILLSYVFVFIIYELIVRKLFNLFRKKYGKYFIHI